MNFIPVTAGEQLTAYVGSNGVGKSSILEALDSYFNNRKWNINKSFGRQTESYPFIAPLFLIKKDDPFFKAHPINAEILEKLEQLSSYFWSVNRTKKDITPNNKSYQDFFKFREKLLATLNTEDYYFFPLGIEENNHLVFWGFQTSILQKIDKTKISDNKEEERANLHDYSKALLAFINKLYSYTYLPVEIDEREFTKLENSQIQKLIGKNVKKLITQTIDEAGILKPLNDTLDDFVNKIDSALVNYKYHVKKSKGARKNVTANVLLHKIIEVYFEIRPLYNAEAIEISALSAGEKKKALIEICYALIKNSDEPDKKIIIGVDEPESSLHVTACYNQFEKIKEMSTKAQVLITTHWYGFLPIISQGEAHFLDRNEEQIAFETYDLMNIAEKVKLDQTESRKEIPFDSRLKSYNDLNQSIFYSLVGEDSAGKNCYNWLVCEGLSDKIYLSCFLAKEIEESNLRILPVGGAPIVRSKIFEPLRVFIKNETMALSGKILCLIDTDNEGFASDDYGDSSNTIFIRRFYAGSDAESEIELKILNNTNIERTVIEDCLAPSIFLITIKDMEEFKTLSFFDKIDEKFISDSKASKNCLDLSKTEQAELNKIFELPNFKVKFANEYCANFSLIGDKEPIWIQDIIKLIKNGTTVKKSKVAA